jgi:hypothetical protein
MNCPICGRFSPDGSPRCTACGVDFRDPDLHALLRAPAAAIPAIAPPGVGAAALASDRILLLSRAGLADGSSLRRIALIGAGLLLIGAVIPLQLGDRTRFPLAALGPGPAAAILVPFILAVAGLAIALPRRGAVPIIAIAGLLAAGGLVELALGLVQFGRFAQTPVELPVATWLPVAAGAVGACLRVLAPTDPRGPWIVVAAAVAFIGGGLIPHDDVQHLLPIELSWLDVDGRIDGSVHGVCYDAVVATAPDTTLLGVALLSPVVLLPMAAAFALRRPTGVWDLAGNLLRVLGTALAVWLPVVFVIATLNVSEWPEQEARALYLGRLRLALLSGGAMLWLTAGSVALVVAFTGGSAGTGSAPRTRRTGPGSGRG